jgi:hypothetical protein
MVVIGSNDTFADGSSEGNVSPLYTQSNKAFFGAGIHNDKPACSTAAEEWAVDISTATGKAMYAMLLTAYTLNTEIVIIGTGECTTWADREDVRYMRLP